MFFSETPYVIDLSGKREWVTPPSAQPYGHRKDTVHFPGGLHKSRFSTQAVYTLPHGNLDTPPGRPRRPGCCILFPEGRTIYIYIYHLDRKPAPGRPPGYCTLSVWYSNLLRILCLNFKAALPLAAQRRNSSAVGDEPRRKRAGAAQATEGEQCTNPRHTLR